MTAVCTGSPPAVKPRLLGKTVELPARHRDGTEFPIELSLSRWEEQGQPAFGAIIRDIRERRANEERLFRLAHLDPLTELPNRAVLRERLTEIVTAMRAVSVLMFDLDGFKEINDSHGHATGDAALKAMAARLLACVRPIDTVSRLGGDEFVLIMPDIGDPLRAAAVAEAIITAVAEPFEHAGQTLRSVRASASPSRPPMARMPTTFSPVRILLCTKPRARGDIATGCSPPCSESGPSARVRCGTSSAVPWRMTSSCCSISRRYACGTEH